MSEEDIMANENKDTKTTIAELQARAAEVAETAERHSAAIRAERDAEAEVLAAGIEAVRPALPALCSRIKRSSYETAGRNGCNPVSRYDYHGERGAVLVDNYDSEKDETGNRGRLGGERLYLLSDGRLAVVTRDGSFSHWQGEADRWESRLAVVTPREAMNDYELDAVLAALAEALDKQARGHASENTEKALARAAALRDAVKAVQS